MSTQICFHKAAIGREASGEDAKQNSIICHIIILKIKLLYFILRCDRKDHGLNSL